MSRFGVADWEAVVAALGSSRDVALACHVNPDGDALGSLLAASLGLRAIGKRTYPSWGADPTRVPEAYAFLPAAASIVPPGEVPATECFLALDCGSADRLGTLEEKAKASRRLINIDHHPGNASFGHLNVVVPSASSTAEIVTRLLQDLGVALDRDIAICLYTGIVTDTGRFQYQNSTPDTLRLAADLLSYGVPAPQIAQEVFESAPFGYLKLVGRVLERARLFEHERLVYSWITTDDLAGTGVEMDATDKLIDMIRATRAADVAVIFKEQDDGRFRVSMRSKGPSVGAIARSRGGGGHDLAAGFTAPAIDAALTHILQALRAERTTTVSS